MIKSYHLGEERQYHSEVYLSQEHNTAFQVNFGNIFQDLLRKLKFFGTSFKG